MKTGEVPEYADIRVRIADRVATVTIDRPQAMNALTLSAKQQLLDFFRFADGTDLFQVVILTGAGEVSFCAGTDVKEMKNFSPFDGERMLWVEHRMNEALRRCSKPVIAAVNGHAIGGGLLTAILCDYAIVSDQALLGFPEMKAGLPASIEIAALPRYIGLARAKEMVYFGETVSPDEAQRIGLINRVAPRAAVMDEARAAARKMMNHSGLVLRLQKELIGKWLETDFTAATETAIYAAGLAFAAGEPKVAYDRKKPATGQGGNRT